MLNYFALTVTTLYNGKKLLYSLKQETTYLLAFRRIDAFHILHQGVNSQHSHRESFQL